MKVTLFNSLSLKQSLVYSQEGIELLDAAKDRNAPSIYILLTDTKTQFSKVSRLITGDPYNHVSLMLTDNFDDPIYTYALNNGISSVKGGFMPRRFRVRCALQYRSKYRRSVDRLHQL